MQGFLFFFLVRIIIENPKDARRLNCTHYRICNELGVTKDQYIKATKKPYSFLYIFYWQTYEKSKTKLLRKHIM